MTIVHPDSLEKRLSDRTVMLHEGRIIFDVSGVEPGLEVTDLLHRFQELRQEELADDALLLS